MKRYCIQTKAGTLGGRWQYMLELGEATIKVETLDEFADEVLSLWIPTSACIVFDAAGG
ncbi:MAG: hypothetical protein H0V63_04085 [Burkholderiaceae bacterium]|nr:hypothetical protein [Burkholderiaceae bacterium]